jgi:polysaccharide deacetylase family protein (PEP-CTERM system associated)
VSSEAVINAISVDVEEYYHALVFREGIGGRLSGRPESRVEGSVARILDLFGERRIRATFFVLGEVAATHPGMVRRIAAEGHEVASHGYHHELVSALTRAQFEADVRRARVVLEDTVGQSVLGYRAPNFSIAKGQSWAYEVLIAEGFRYDSSCYPIRHDRYGDPLGRRFPYTIHGSGESSLIEFPIGTARVLRINLPIGGGGYFRLLPGHLVRLGIERVNRRERRPVMFYFHPWELDPRQPRPAMAWRHRARHYVGIRRQETKLRRLLRHVRFGPAREVLGMVRGGRV